MDKERWGERSEVAQELRRKTLLTCCGGKKWCTQNARELCLLFFTLKRNRRIEKITVPPCRHPLEIYGTNVLISCFQIPSFCGRWGTGVTLRTSTWICLATQKQGQAKLCSGCTLSRVRLGAVQEADCGSDRGGRAKTLCLASAPQSDCELSPQRDRGEAPQRLWRMYGK